MSVQIELLTVAAEVFITWYFYTGVLGKTRQSVWLKTAVLTLYFALIASLSVFMGTGIVRLSLMLLLTFAFAKLYFDRPWLSLIYPTVLFFLLAVASDVLCGSFLQTKGASAQALMGNGNIRMIYNAMGKLCHLLLAFISLTFMKFKTEKAAVLRAFPLLSCQMVSIVIYHFNFASALQGTKSNTYSLEAMGLLYINIIVCIYIELLNRYYEERSKAELSRQQLEVQKNEYMQIMERQELTRALWHDIKKYAAAMETLARSDAGEETQRILSDLKTRFEPIENVYDTGNGLVDSILNYGAKKAAEQVVRINAEVWVDGHFDFPAADLFVIIGNTIDNAIEACVQLERYEDRRVDILLKQRNHMIFYEIRNKFDPSQKKKGGGIHGYGLKNVKACVERNEGIISIRQENCFFTLTVQLNLGDQAESA